MNTPIGVIDSGVGGLTVVKEIMRQLPNETIYYLGDVSRCPYGPRPKEEVLQYTTEIAQFLVHQNIKLLVIACNTATAVALKSLRKTLNIPVIGVIDPGAKTALQASTNHYVQVLATEGTVASHAYKDAIHKVNKSVQVDELACPKFVPLVEQLRYKDEVIRGVVIHQQLKQIQDTEADTIILGCTHYPLIQSSIEAYFHGNKKVISSGYETAREVSSILGFMQLHASKVAAVEHKFFVHGSSDRFQYTIEEWLNIEDSHIIELSTTILLKEDML